MRVECVLGVDGGGSRTRVACLGLDGTELGWAEGAGASPQHNEDAKQNVQATVQLCLQRAGFDTSNVVAVTAGLAALGSEADRSWAEDFFALPGLVCPRELINDAVVAQAGAFAAGPGVVVVAGTGSMILGRTEAGMIIRNDRYPHYAGGARHLSFDVIVRILVGDTVTADSDFLTDVLHYWDCDDLDGLRRRVIDLEGAGRQLVKRRYGGMAPLITAAAESSPVASASVDWLVNSTALGVRLLASDFTSSTVPVAGTGALARAPVFERRLAEVLERTSVGRIRLEAPVLTPTYGAGLMALRLAGQPVEAALITQLRKQAESPH